MHFDYLQQSTRFWCLTHREHEESVEDESHGRERLDRGHHVPLQTQREHNEQRHNDEQHHTKAASHLTE